DACGAGRDGLTAQTIAEAARAYGLHVKGYSLEPAMCGLLSGPAIVHWSFNHSIVLERWTPRYVDIVDPAVGRRRLTQAEFDAGFTGVVLSLEPGPEFERASASTESNWYAALVRLAGVPGVRPFLVQVLVAS